MTRNGKIARLPRPVREQLNRRLDDGESGKALVAWLNGLPEVRERIKQDFHGKVISEQNLSEWKQGGFQDWRRHQESRESTRATVEESQELAADAGPMPLSETFSATVSFLMAKLVREAGGSSPSTPEERRELLALIREWTALRTGDQRAARLKMEMEAWRNNQARVAAFEQRLAATAAARTDPAKGQPPEWTRAIRQRNPLALELPNPTESDPIRPDQTKKNLHA